MAQLVKNTPAIQETWVQSLGWKDPLEKGKATHSSILAWRIPWTFIVHRVAKSRTRLSDFHFHTILPWTREWQPTPVFLPGESHEQRSLVGYSHKESDMTKRLTHATLRIIFKAPFAHFLHSVLVLGFYMIGFPNLPCQPLFLHQLS